MAGSLTALSAHRFGRAREELQTAELREQADYEDFYEATQEEAAEVFMQAERFIAAVESYLREQKIL